MIGPSAVSDATMRTLAARRATVRLSTGRQCHLVGWKGRCGPRKARVEMGNGARVTVWVHDIAEIVIENIPL